MISRSCGGAPRSSPSLPRWRSAAVPTAATDGRIRSGWMADSDDVPLVRPCATLIAAATALATGTPVSSRGGAFVARRLAATPLRPAGAPPTIDGRQDRWRGATRPAAHPLGDGGGESLRFHPPLPVHLVVRAIAACGARAHVCARRRGPSRAAHAPRSPPCVGRD